MILTQISKREGTIRRVPRGQTPVIETYLEPGEYVVNVELRDDERYFSNLDRVTVDWSWTAYVVTPLVESPPE